MCISRPTRMSETENIFDDRNKTAHLHVLSCLREVQNATGGFIFNHREQLYAYYYSLSLSLTHLKVQRSHSDGEWSTYTTLCGLSSYTYIIEQNQRSAHNKNKVQLPGEACLLWPIKGLFYSPLQAVQRLWLMNCFKSCTRSHLSFVHHRTLCPFAQSNNCNWSLLITVAS